MSEKIEWYRVKQKERRVNVKPKKFNPNVAVDAVIEANKQEMYLKLKSNDELCELFYGGEIDHRDFFLKCVDVLGVS